jgi:DNA repair exonuclease SbcCD ATPase subunit
MKNKSVAVKISESSNLVKSVKRNKKAAQLKALKKPMQTLTSDLEAAASLQKAVQKLKKDLKNRKKELEAQLKKLAASRKEVKKAFGKGKKTALPVKKVKKIKKTPKSKIRKPGTDKPKEVIA